MCQLLPPFQHLGDLSLEAALFLLQGLHGQLPGKREAISKGQGPACGPACIPRLPTEHLLLLPPRPEPWRRDPQPWPGQAPPLRMLVQWLHTQLRIQLPQEGRREGGREMGYREERGKVEAEGKAITPEAWKAGLEARLPRSQPRSPAAQARPRPLHVPRVLESVSSGGGVGGEVAVARPPSGPGGGLFSQLLVPSAQCKGEQLSQASGMCSESGEA